MIVTLALLTWLSTVFLSENPAHAATMPSGFADERVAGVPAPTAVAFTPDGRMLVTSQQGQLLVYKDGAQLSTALNLGSGVCTSGERGLLGVAADPEFATNNYLYLYYTANRSGTCVNRVERYTLSDGNAATTSKVLIDNIPSPSSNHNAGDLHFGKDGYLYVSVGDGGCDYAGDSGCAGANDAARDTHVLLAKILRVTRDGGIPTTNPYATTGDSCAATGRTTSGRQCQETFASGLRNPFRFAFDPNAQDTRFFINDVGQNNWEEVDEGQAGADYGWNVREGYCANGSTTDCGSPPAGMTNPIHAYGRSVGGSITGGAFVLDGVWPSEYKGSYLFGDYVVGKIFKLWPDGTGGYARADFATDLGSGGPVAMAFGPHGDNQALYYTTYVGGEEVRRISYTGTPTAALTANPTYGPTPLAVNFDGSGSRDPNPGDTLTYLWDFGDGTTTETTTSTTSHTYTKAPASPATYYTVTLKVRDSSGVTSAPATVQIYAGNDAPTPTITSPTANDRFHVGQEITLTGSATDPEDGPLANDKLSWEVVQHHNASHTHPYFSGTGNNLKFQAPPPEDLPATGAGSYLEIKLTATDSKGLKKTVTQALEPKRVEVTFNTDTSGLKLRVNGEEFTAPKTFTSWEGYELKVEALDQVDSGGWTQKFDSWPDGGTATHTITTPANPTTYTATFKPVPKVTTFGTLSASPTVVDYDGTTALTGKLSTSSGPVPDRTVTVWKSTDNGTTWTQEGTATYDATSENYTYTTSPLTQNATFQMRFAGDSLYEKATSSNADVKARAYLSTPTTPDVVKTYTGFTIEGFLKPHHSGTTRLYFEYYYPNSGWQPYSSLEAPNSSYLDHTKYSLDVYVINEGFWRVYAYHSDANHAETRSAAKEFRATS